MPRAGLDANAVVAAAAAVADADGLDAVTLARLAADLGVRAPSLYTHVAGLPDLRQRLAARGARELAAALGAAAAGRSGSDALAAAGAAVDVVVAVLRGYGLDGEEAIHATRIVRSALHGFAALETDEGFGIPLDLDATFARLVAVLDAGLGRLAKMGDAAAEDGQ
jgi:AcrR family transcriptional regulator